MKKVYGFRITFHAPIDFAFSTQVARNAAMRKAKKALASVGIMRSDYRIDIAQGIPPAKLRIIK